MIYNLWEYIRLIHTTFDYAVNGWQKDSLDNSILISESGGDPNPQHDRNDFTIQIISRAKSKPTARKQIMDIYDTIQKKFGIELPAVTVDSIVFPAVKTWKIAALALPGFIGNDDNGRPQFSVNFVITTN